MNKSMILITSKWAEKSTFKLIPTALECPFNEAIFDPEARVLAVISKEKKPAYHMLPKLDDNGDPLLAKRRTTENPNPYAQQRVAIETYYEYFIESEKEIADFIIQFASNAADFDFVSHLNQAFAGQNEQPVLTK